MFVALLAVRRLPGMLAHAPFHERLAPLVKMVAHGLRLAPKDDDIEKTSLLLPGLPGLIPMVGGQTKGGHSRPRGGHPQFRVTTQVPDENNLVKRCRHAETPCSFWCSGVHH